MRMDLHMHSHYSDGVLSPSELLSRAHRQGAEVVALTDHDTIDGVREADLAGQRLGIRNIRGVEISTFDRHEIHILGYNVDIDSPTLNSALKQLVEWRNIRNEKILDVLNSKGYCIEKGEIMALAQGIVSKVHFAKVLLSKRYFNDFDSAMAILKRGGSCFVENKEITPQKAIEIISNAGGVAFLAHPDLIGLQRHEQDAFVGSLSHSGLSGIECVYRKHSKDATKNWRRLASKYGLAVSIGGDNHLGEAKDFFIREADSDLIKCLKLD